jgi:hypothetical protein
MYECFVKRSAESCFATNDLQFAYKKNSGCSTAFFCFSEVISYYNCRNTPVYTAFLDATKAFNRVSHFALLYKLLRRGMDTLIVLSVEHWLRHGQCRVVHDGVSSGAYAPKAGIRQGGVLSGNFYTIYIDDLINCLEEKNWGVSVSGRYFGILVYADDIVLISSMAAILQKMVNQACTYGADKSVVFNPRKSCCLYFVPKRYAHISLPVIRLNGVVLPVVHEYKYLGFSVSCSKHGGLSLNFARNLRAFFC